jgi:putative ABC transport system ATP-binding protein
MYTLTGVTKNYRKDSRTVIALAGIDLVIADGEWLAIQGRTGHGKTTLLHLLGLDRPISGTIELDGTNLAAISETAATMVRATSIGFIFQTFNLIPTLSAAENVEAGLIPLGIRAAERRARVTMALHDVGLADRARHLPTELSGGQQQRVAIAQALAKQPQVLLADEPAGNLDQDTRDDIITLLGKLRRDNQLTLIFVTHDTTIAYRAQRVAAMTHGRLSIRQNSPHQGRNAASPRRIVRWFAGSSAPRMPFKKRGPPSPALAAARVVVCGPILSTGRNHGTDHLPALHIHRRVHRRCPWAQRPAPGLAARR